MAKHTAAPWNTGETIIVHANTLENLGASIGFINTSDEDRKAIAKANSCLIAAAPELLDALRELDECYCETGNDLSKEDRLRHRMTLIKARAAIAKATGAVPSTPSQKVGDGTGS